MCVTDHAVAAAVDAAVAAASAASTVINQTCDDSHHVDNYSLC